MRDVNCFTRLRAVLCETLGKSYFRERSCNVLYRNLLRGMSIDMKVSTRSFENCAFDNLTRGSSSALFKPSNSMCLFDSRWE